MGAVTWKNIAPVSSAGILNSINEAGQQIGTSIGGIGDAFTQYADDKTDAATGDAIAALLQAGSNAERQQILNQQITDGSGFIDQNLLGKAFQEQSEYADTRDLNQANLRLRAAQTANQQFKLEQDAINAPFDRYIKGADIQNRRQDMYLKQQQLQGAIQEMHFARQKGVNDFQLGIMKLNVERMQMQLERDNRNLINNQLFPEPTSIPSSVNPTTDATNPIDAYAAGYASVNNNAGTDIPTLPPGVTNPFSVPVTEDAAPVVTNVPITVTPEQTIDTWTPKDHILLSKFKENMSDSKTYPNAAAAYDSKFSEGIDAIFAGADLKVNGDISTVDRYDNKVKINNFIKEMMPKIDRVTANEFLDAIQTRNGTDPLTVKNRQTAVDTDVTLAKQTAVAFNFKEDQKLNMIDPSKINSKTIADSIAARYAKGVTWDQLGKNLTGTNGLIIKTLGEEIKTSTEGQKLQGTVTAMLTAANAENLSKKEILDLEARIATLGGELNTFAHNRLPQIREVDSKSVAVMLEDRLNLPKITEKIVEHKKRNSLKASYFDSKAFHGMSVATEMELKQQLGVTQHTSEISEQIKGLQDELLTLMPGEFNPEGNVRDKELFYGLIFENFSYDPESFGTSRLNFNDSNDWGGIWNDIEMDQTKPGIWRFDRNDKQGMEALTTLVKRMRIKLTDSAQLQKSHVTKGMKK